MTTSWSTIQQCFLKTLELKSQHLRRGEERGSIYWGKKKPTPGWPRGEPVPPVHAHILCARPRGFFPSTGRVLYTASCPASSPDAGGERSPHAPIPRGRRCALNPPGRVHSPSLPSLLATQPYHLFPCLLLKSWAHRAPFCQPWSKGTSVTDPKF